ncbi:MAG: mannitol/fructose-specific phosphotransferase system IIA component, partial [Cellvibrionaceae bacterium]
RYLTGIAASNAEHLGSIHSVFEILGYSSFLTR